MWPHFQDLLKRLRQVHHKCGESSELLATLSIPRSCAHPARVPSDVVPSLPILRQRAPLAMHHRLKVGHRAIGLSEVVLPGARMKRVVLALEGHNTRNGTSDGIPVALLQAAAALLIAPCFPTAFLILGPSSEPASGHAML